MSFGFLLVHVVLFPFGEGLVPVQHQNRDFRLKSNTLSFPVLTLEKGDISKLLSMSASFEEQKKKLISELIHSHSPLSLRKKRCNPRMSVRTRIERKRKGVNTFVFTPFLFSSGDPVKGLTQHSNVRPSADGYEPDELC